MTTAVSGATHAPPAATPEGQGSGDRVLVILDGGDGYGRLEDELTGLGWRVWTAGVRADDLDAYVDGITDVLAAPESPARVVLLGHGEAGPAALEVADRHPERVTAVVVVAACDPVLDAASDLLCPALVLSDAAPEAVLSAVVPFLTGLDRPAGDAASCPVRLPVLTPVLLNDSGVIRQLREAGPVHRINAAGVATSWILTGHEATTSALADPRLVGEVEITAGFRLPSPDPALAHRGEQDLITITGDEHARLRRLIGRHLTPRRVEALRPRIRRETDALLDALPLDEEIDLLQAFARPLPIIVLCELFGVPERDRGYIHEWLVERMVSPPPRAYADVDDYLYGLIEERKARPSDDLLGWVVEAEGDRLSEEDLVAATRFLMVGGHRAPTTLLASGVAALLRRRDQWERLVNDPALAGAATEELLRFVTPFPMGLARQVTAPIEVGGTTVPAGDLVSASLVAANRDPAFFADPDVLDVTRAGNPHLAFGHGHHFCLGASLARAQTQIALGTLARRFPDLELADESRSLHYRRSRVRYLLGLPVVLAPGRRREPDGGT